MNHVAHHRGLRHAGWLVAPLLLMVALCAHAQDNAQPQGKAQAQSNTQSQSKKPSPSKKLLLAQNNAQTVQQSNQTAQRPQLQEVVVTGSRIARALNDTLQPTVEISSATFEQRGYTNVSQALDEMPEFGVPPTSQQNQQSAFSVGQSFVDLYSLGSQRTLTLVDWAAVRLLQYRQPRRRGQPGQPGRLQRHPGPADRSRRDGLGRRRTDLRCRRHRRNGERHPEARLPGIRHERHDGRVE